MTRLPVRTVAVNEDRPLLELLPDPDGVVWVRGFDGLVGWGEAARFDPGTGEDRFARAAEWFGQVVASARVDDQVGAPGCGLVAFASFTFDPSTSGSVLVVPAVVVGRRHGGSWLTLTGSAQVPSLVSVAVPGPGDRVRYAGASKPDLRWLEAIAEAITRIEDGRLDKVVLARDELVWTRSPVDARLLTRRLHDRFGDCWTFLVDALVGATPELLVRRAGDQITSIVLAGSARRGDDVTDDVRIGEELLASKKDRHEHQLAVDSVRDVLAGRCEHLQVDNEPWLRRLANVQHLATTVSGRTREAGTALELAGALHPTAAVGGAPTDVAIDVIRELEGMDRGRYAGPVGWVDARGDGEFGIALRCAQIAGARARLFAGAGVVAGSLPEEELEETRLKLRAMQSAFEG
ncbi:MAG: isochorismate synthase [Actinobacteria bacterium]|nr:isochorismate synthase [Actinomycetota bacterium]